MGRELFYLLRETHEDSHLPGFRLLNWHFFLQQCYLYMVAFSVNNWSIQFPVVNGGSEHQALLFSSFARLMIKVIVLTGVALVFITSIVWTTCKKPYSKGTSTYPRQSLDGSDDNPTMNPMSNWPVEKCEATKFTCPLLQRPGEWLDWWLSMRVNI